MYKPKYHGYKLPKKPTKRQIVLTPEMQELCSMLTTFLCAAILIGIFIGLII